MSLWKPIDRLGYKLATWWNPLKQVRTGVVLTITGLVLIPVGFFVGEPLLVYEMSAAALVFGGLGVIVTAVLALASDEESSAEELLNDDPL